MTALIKVAQGLANERERKYLGIHKLCDWKSQVDLIGNEYKNQDLV